MKFEWNFRVSGNDSYATLFYGYILFLSLHKWDGDNFFEAEDGRLAFLFDDDIVAQSEDELKAHIKKVIINFSECLGVIENEI